MSATDWSTFREWHQLLDALCRQRGHRGDDALASDFCSRSGRTSQADFEAARKRIRAWRRGRNHPLRRNAALLGSILGVDGDPALEKAWIELYRRSQAVSSREPVAAAPPPRLRPAISKAMFAGGVGLCMAVLAFPLFDAADALQDELPIVNFEGRIRVPAGASVLVHGHAGDCNGTPPRWEEIAIDVPSSMLGEFSDGGLARKVARKCVGDSVVRAVKFTAANAGTEVVRLFGDSMRLEVVAQHNSHSRGDRHAEQFLFQRQALE